MAFLFFMTIPGLVCLLVLLATIDRLGLWLHRRTGFPWYRDGRRPATAASFDELQAVFHAGERYAIEQRQQELRDDGQDGQPLRVDLEAGQATIVTN